QFIRIWQKMHIKSRCLPIIIRNQDKVGICPTMRQRHLFWSTFCISITTLDSGGIIETNDLATLGSSDNKIFLTNDKIKCVGDSVISYMVALIVPLRDCQGYSWHCREPQ